jgi:ABC-2 type transport system permease protein
MNPQRILTIVDKEFTQAFKKFSAWSIIIIPQAVLTSLLLYILHALTVWRGGGGLPDWVMDYFLMFFVAMPVVNATIIAASGIMGDKAAKSLEPLLATPLTPFEFIFGKLLVAVLPPVFVTGIAFKIFIHLAGNWGIAKSNFFADIGSASCFCAVMGMALLLTNVVALNGFLIAARKTEARSAALSSTTAAEGILLLPMFGVYYGYSHHIAGNVWALEGIGILFLANLLLFLYCLKRFQRETILFKWK